MILNSETIRNEVAVEINIESLTDKMADMLLTESDMSNHIP